MRTRLVAFSLGCSGPCSSKCAGQGYSLPLDRILTLSQPAHSEIDPPSETTMLSFKILRGRLNLDYRLPSMRLSRSGSLVAHTPLCLTRSTWSIRRLLVRSGSQLLRALLLCRALFPLFPLLPAIPRLRFLPGAYLPPSPSLLPRSSSVVVFSVSRSQVLLPGSSYALALLQDCFRPIPP